MCGGGHGSGCSASPAATRSRSRAAPAAAPATTSGGASAEADAATGGSEGRLDRRAVVVPDVAPPLVAGQGWLEVCHRAPPPALREEPFRRAHEAVVYEPDARDVAVGASAVDRVATAVEQVPLDQHVVQPAVLGAQLQHSGLFVGVLDGVAADEDVLTAGGLDRVGVAAAATREVVDVAVLDHHVVA